MVKVCSDPYTYIFIEVVFSNNLPYETTYIGISQIFCICVVYSIRVSITVSTHAIVILIGYVKL